MPMCMLLLFLGSSSALSAKRSPPSPKSSGNYITNQMFDEDGSLRPVEPVAAFGYLAIFGQLSLPALVAGSRLGLIELPPVNLFTDIANQAMEEKFETASYIEKLVGATPFSQGVWRDLIAQYYDSGSSTTFLTATGGVCSEHPAWCAGLSIP